MSSPRSTADEFRMLLPVYAVLCRLYTHVDLQHRLVIHVGLTVAFEGFVSHGPPQEGLEGEGLQLQGSGG